MNKQALILTWEGYQDQEVQYPYYRLLEDEFHVDVAAGNIGTFYGILGTKMEANVRIDRSNVGPSFEDRADKYNLLVLPGGVKALEKLRQEKHVLTFIQNYVSSGRVVASTCHGAQLLISAKVTQGREISGYYSIADDIRNSGATYVDAPYVISDTIVSSPHYKHMGPWMKAALDLYYTINHD